MSIRWMIQRDMPEVVDIENKSFNPPWSEEEFYSLLKNKFFIGLVYEIDEKIIGYIIYELERKRLIVHNLAIHPEYRNKKIATKMLDHLKKKLSIDRRNEILVNVRETNLTAQLFFRSSGFFAIETVKGGYNINEDSYIMKLTIEDLIYS